MYGNPTEKYYPRSSAPSYQNSYNHSTSNLSKNEVSRIVNEPLRDGEVVKGKSRIQYVPYEKKVT